MKFAIFSEIEVEGEKREFLLELDRVDFVIELERELDVDSADITQAINNIIEKFKKNP
jgi:hypothetical protein